MRMKWACPKYGGIRVVWCGPCLRRWVCPHVREGSGWHGIGGDKQVLNVHTHTHRHIHTHTHKDWLQHIVIPMSTRAHTHTHTSISTHDKVTQVTFTHSRCTNVISSLTSIIGLLSVHSGQWSSCCNGGSSSGPDSTGELSPH